MRLRRSSHGSGKGDLGSRLFGLIVQSEDQQAMVHTHSITQGSSTIYRIRCILPLLEQDAFFQDSCRNMTADEGAHGMHAMRCATLVFTAVGRMS